MQTLGGKLKVLLLNPAKGGAVEGLFEILHRLKAAFPEIEEVRI